MSELTFKIATEEWEFEAIHKLNYNTFVHEIPQHADNDEGKLIDKFHKENSYCIALLGDRLVGMVCLRGVRPFSLDYKLTELDAYLPKNRRICEFRLLTVDKEYRNTRTTAMLLTLLAQHALAMGYDCAIISGTTRQLKLYRHVGFVPFGPMVGSGDAMFQPMFLTLEAFEKHSAKIIGEAVIPSRRESVENFLPGPVSIAPEVVSAFQSAPVSHRSTHFVSDFQATKRRLCDLTNANDVEILLGSGTMANEVIASHLSAMRTPGLILSNGEFGERLVDHAQRQGLSFEVLKLEWGASFDVNKLAGFVNRNSHATWLWVVHCETSTGVLNDLTLLSDLCEAHAIKLCIDAISSIGVVPVSLRNIYLASGGSGKGLASYPGLSLVFHNHSVRPEPFKIPRYLDLGYYEANEGIPFTQCSNLVYALKTALESQDWHRKFSDLIDTSSWLRKELNDMVCSIVAEDRSSSPAVITLALSDFLNSRNVGWRMEQTGFVLHYRSEYLLRRNWLQICLMGAYRREGLQAMLAQLKQELRSGENSRSRDKRQEEG